MTDFTNLNKNDETQIAGCKLECLSFYGNSGVNKVSADALQDGQAAGALWKHGHTAVAIHAHHLQPDAPAQRRVDEDG